MNSQAPATSPVSSCVPDWSREKPYRLWDPAKRLLRSIRCYQKLRTLPGLLGKVLAYPQVLRHRFWTVISGADIPLNCHLEGGLLLPHANGVVIHPDAYVGPNCTLFQQVTLVSGVRLGGHVDIGAGAKIIRSVSIGDHAKIGANAVVLTDIPPGATAVGIPAKVLEQG